MPTFTTAFFGDVVGASGQSAFAAGVKRLREAQRADVVVVNGENHKAGSGLTPEGYKELRRAGADAITLGDHCFKDRRIVEVLDDPTKPAARPMNLSWRTMGKGFTLLTPESTASGAHEPNQSPRRALPAGSPPLVIVTVLGRLFMPMPANDPFEAVDRLCERLEAEHPDALVIVEVHAEATSEKIAMAWHCHERHPGRVVAVVGTHTHVQTADARIIDQRLAAITDLGMCGGHRGVIGRKVEPVLEGMTRQNPLKYDVADEEPLACGVLIRLDTDQRRAVAIEAFRLAP